MGSYLGLGIMPYGVNIKDKDFQRKQYVISMFNRTMQMFKYNRLPDTIPKRELEKLLQLNGWACLTKVRSKYYVFNGGLGGPQDEYYLPTLCNVDNPALDFHKTLEIGKDCVIIRNDSFYNGLLPLFNKYGEMLATNDITIYNTDILCRIQALLLAGDNNAKKEAKLYMDSIQKGDLSFLNSNSFKENIQSAPYAANAGNQLTNLIELEQYLKASCLNDIGLNANWNAKRESLNSNESQLNGDYLLPLCDNMLDCRREGFEQAKALWGDIDVTVEFASSWEDIQVRESEEASMDAENKTEEAVNDNETR